MKQILLINDVVGYSKVGMVAMLPILSYLGIPTYSLPTALVSNTLDYGKFNIQDTTDYIRGTLPVWKELGFSFDAVCTGLMFSDEQARLVAGYCKEQGALGTRRRCSTNCARSAVSRCSSQVVRSTVRMP